MSVDGGGNREVAITNAPTSTFSSAPVADHNHTQPPGCLMNLQPFVDFIERCSCIAEVLAVLDCALPAHAASLGPVIPEGVVAFVQMLARVGALREPGFWLAMLERVPMCWSELEECARHCGVILFSGSRDYVVSTGFANMLLLIEYHLRSLSYALVGGEQLRKHIDNVRSTDFLFELIVGFQQGLRPYSTLHDIREDVRTHLLALVGLRLEHEDIAFSSLGSLLSTDINHYTTMTNAELWGTSSSYRSLKLDITRSNVDTVMRGGRVERLIFVTREDLYQERFLASCLQHWLVELAMKDHPGRIQTRYLLPSDSAHSQIIELAAPIGGFHPYVCLRSRSESHTFAPQSRSQLDLVTISRIPTDTEDRWLEERKFYPLYNSAQTVASLLQAV